MLFQKYLILTYTQIAELIYLFISIQVTKSNTNPDDLGGLANQLTNEFGNLANEAKYAALTAENDEVNKNTSSSIDWHLKAHANSQHRCHFLNVIRLICLFPDWFSHQEAGG